MKTNFINFSLGVFILFSIIVISCSKDDSKQDNNPDDQNPELLISGNYTGSMSTGNVNNSLQGYFSIDENNNFKLALLSGNLSGTSVMQNNDSVYNITVNAFSGVFEGSSDMSGELDVTSMSLTLNGTYIDGNPLSLNGLLQTIEEAYQEWIDNLSKTSVFFTHNEMCMVSITVDGLTLEDSLGPHYHAEGGLCAPMYGGFLSLHVDVDNQSSTTLCHTVTLLGLDGEYFSYETCPSAIFVLDKETTYSYTANWGNGEVSSGEFTTVEGGSRIAICLDNDGEDCEDGGGNGIPNSSENILTVDGVEFIILENIYFPSYYIGEGLDPLTTSFYLSFETHDPDYYIYLFTVKNGANLTLENFTNDTYTIPGLYSDTTFSVTNNGYWENATSGTFEIIKNGDVWEVNLQNGVSDEGTNVSLYYKGAIDEEAK